VNAIEFAAVLLALTIVFVSIGRRWHIPYPVVLVLGGLLLGFFPRLPKIHVDPETALVLFLPPLLYWEAVSAPTQAMRRNSKWLISLALGLVFVTAWGVALAVHLIEPAHNIAIALVLGAILAPTDAVAPAAIAERLHVPRNVVSIVQGESLLNDAAALGLYGVALASVASGTLVPGRAFFHFVLAAIGALAIGLVVGWLAVQAWRRINDPELESVVSIVLPFIAYIPATRMGLSGVLAVVSAGLYVNRYIPVVMSPIARLRSYGYWETLVFVTNALIFLSVGLALHEAVEALHEYRIGVVIGGIVLVNVVVVGIRFGWIEMQEWIFTLVPRWRGCRLGRKARLVVAWSGLRGGVSLAIALSIPTTLPGGAPFPFRALIIVAAFSVILITLVGGGLSLPYVIRKVGLEPDDEEALELRSALQASATAALRELERLESEGVVQAEQAGALRERYQEVLRHANDTGEHRRQTAIRQVAVEHKLYEAERNVLLALRRSGRIDSVVLQKLQMAVDLSEAGAIARATSS
jgi:CPA1 family monovalent cation:H+ antiporter